MKLGPIHLRTLALAGALVWLGCAQPLYGAEYLTAAAGGGGGNPFTLRCGDDQVLTGVEGSAEAVVDQVKPLCRQVDPAGRWVGGGGTGSAGGTGGRAFSLQCPQNHAVSGIDGRASALVDQLRIKCGPLGAGPRLAASGTVLTLHAGGSGGTPFGPFDCVDDKPGRGLIGRAGVYVDQVRLACDYPPAPLQPLNIYPLRNDNVVTSLIRSPGGVLLVMPLSSNFQGGTYFVPVRNSNPSVASAAGARGEGEVVHLVGTDARTGALDISARSVGCAGFDVGFPGAVLPTVHVLVERPQDAHLALSLSIEQWTAATPNAFGTLTLTSPAPSGGTSVALTSSHPTLALVPPSVTIPQGTRVTSFEIRRAGSEGGCVVVTANGSGSSVQSVMLFAPLPGRIYKAPLLQKR